MKIAAILAMYSKWSAFSNGMNRVKFFGILLAILGIGCGTLPALADSSSLSKGDIAFLNEAYQGGLYEIEVGKYAVTNGKADAVKQFGQQMDTDHTALNQKLADLAQKNGLNLNTEQTTGTATKIKTATLLSGGAFDRIYVDEMIHAHRSDIKAFDKELDSTSNSDISTAIKEALPTLRHHLKMARSTKNTIVNS